MWMEQKMASDGTSSNWNLQPPNPWLTRNSENMSPPPTSMTWWWRWWCSISDLPSGCRLCTCGSCSCGSLYHKPSIHCLKLSKQFGSYCRSPLHRYAERDGLVKALCPWESWWQQCQIPYPPYPLGLVKSCKIYSKANFEFGFFFVQHEPPSITQLSAFCKQDCQGHKSEWQVACGVCCWVCWGCYDFKPHLATLAELPKAPCLKAADSFFSVETAQCFFGALKNFAHTVSQRQWRASTYPGWNSVSRLLLKKPAQVCLWQRHQSWIFESERLPGRQWQLRQRGIEQIVLRRILDRDGHHLGATWWAGCRKCSNMWNKMPGFERVPIPAGRTGPKALCFHVFPCVSCVSIP